MTSKAGFSRGVKKPASRNSRRRRVAKGLAGGLAAITIVAGTTTASLAGIGMLLSATTQARTDMRSAVALALPVGRPAWPEQNWPEQTAEMPVASSIVFKSSPVETQEAVQTASLAPIAEADIVAEPPLALDDGAPTGSIGPTSFKLASLEFTPAPTPPPARARDIPIIAKPLIAKSLIAKPLPLPQPRPRLASLSSGKDIDLQAEEDAHLAQTAIYDIAGQTVYLPSGERLEAHSGLGSMMDEPRFVHERNRGATPPNTYALTLRESLFHGVQAIRLTPVGDGKMFGRDGILAHTYMLGPNGQSNGCVSFRDYQKFLRAYLRGEFNRMLVVSRLAKPPAVVARQNGRGGVKAL